MTPELKAVLEALAYAASTAREAVASDEEALRAGVAFDYAAVEQLAQAVDHALFFGLRPDDSAAEYPHFRNALFEAATQDDAAGALARALEH